MKQPTTQRSASLLLLQSHSFTSTRPEMFRTPTPLLVRCMSWMLAREVVRFRPAPASTRPRRHATLSPVKPFSRHTRFTCRRCFSVKMFPSNLFVVVSLWVWTNWKRPLCVILKKKQKNTSEKILNKLKRKRVIGEACPPPGSRLQSWKAVTGVVHVLVNSLTER